MRKTQHTLMMAGDHKPENAGDPWKWERHEKQLPPEASRKEYSPVITLISAS